MNVMQVLRRFGREESGAATVEWVLLMAASVAIAFVATGAILGKTDAVAAEMGTHISTQTGPYSGGDES